MVDPLHNDPVALADRIAHNLRWLRDVESHTDVELLSVWSSTATLIGELQGYVDHEIQVRLHAVARRQQPDLFGERIDS